MSKIVFFCIPAHGHTNPTLGVVRELIRRGHEVIYYSYNIMKEKIEETGAHFISCDTYDCEQSLTPEDQTRVGKDLAFSMQILVDTTLALDEMITKDLEKIQPDCIVADSMAVWGKAAAIKHHIPFVSSTTTFAFNKHSAKIMKQSPKELFSMIRSAPQINRHIKRLQQNGYPIRSVLDILQNDDQTDTIVYTSSRFQPCAETFSDKYVFVGPSVRPSEEVISKTANKLIYFSMGTVNNDMFSLYQNCIEAFRETPYQVILSVGNLTDLSLFTDIPTNIIIKSHVDQIAVLKEADVFFSHCGMNSVNESLYYSVPLIMMPQTAEQGGVCTRVKQLGAGIQLTEISPQSIRQAAEEIFRNPSYKKAAKNICDSFHQCSGAKGAADKILEVCNK